MAITAFLHFIRQHCDDEKAASRKLGTCQVLRLAGLELSLILGRFISYLIRSCVTPRWSRDGSQVFSGGKEESFASFYLVSEVVYTSMYLVMRLAYSGFL